MMSVPRITPGRIALVALWVAAVVAAGSLYTAALFQAQVNGFNFLVMNPIRWVGAGGGIMTGNITFATRDGVTPASAAMSVKLLCTMPDDVIAVVSPASTRSGRQFTTIQTWDLPVGWTGPIHVPYTLSNVSISLLTGYNAYCQVVAAGQQSGTSSSGAASSSPSAGLLVHYTFDDVTGTTVPDSSGNNRTGTMVSGPTLENGCMRFDGVDDRIDVPNFDRHVFTFAAWAKKEGAVSYLHGLIGSQQNGGWGIGYGNFANNSLSGQSGPRPVFLNHLGIGQTQTSNATVASDEWHHVAVTYDGSNVSFYIDGVLDSTKPYNATFNSNGSIYHLGYRDAGSPASNARLKGLMDDVRIYDHPLTAQEIGQIAQMRPSCESSTGLVAHYTFDQPTIQGNTVLDASNNGHTLTNNGGTPVNGCMLYNGTSSYLTTTLMTGMPSGNAPRSVAYWLNTAAYQDNASPFSLGNSTVTGVNDASPQRFSTGPGSGGPGYYGVFTDAVNDGVGSNNLQMSGNELPPVNTWHHITFTYDGAGRWAYYLDGTLTHAGTFGVGINTVSNALDIGAFRNYRHQSSADYFFKGQMDDVRVYDRVLTTQEITQIAQTQPSCTSASSAASSASGPQCAEAVLGTYDWHGILAENPSFDWHHSMTITSYNPATGAFSGNGYWIGGPVQTWDVQGTITGSNITGNGVYTNINAGYNYDFTGTITPDGTITGTLIDSAQRPGTFTATKNQQVSCSASSSSSLHGGPTAPPQCSDGLDNDADGRTDMADPGCKFLGDDDETDLPKRPSICVASSSSSRSGGLSSRSGGSSSRGSGSSSSFRGGPGTCGNGTVDAGEQCDDGNRNDTDSCSNTCRSRCASGTLCPDGQMCPQNGVCPATCGNGQLDDTEECDIGSENGRPGSGCSAQCTFGSCTPGELCPNGAECQLNGTCPDLCPDGLLDANEQCDDGNMNNTDACTNSCLLACDAGEACPGGLACPQNGVCPSGCGNGSVDSGEQCDDGNGVNTDACTTSCQRTCGPGGVCPNGMVCPASGVCPNTVCGNGKEEGNEQCDDGNTVDTDACTNLCLLGNGSTCSEASQCQSALCVNGMCTACDTTADCPSGLLCLDRRCVPNPVCGNGKAEFSEVCDDGDRDDTDACSNACRKGNNLPCTGDNECASLLCIDGLCAACTSNSQCESGVCKNGRCTDGCGDSKVTGDEECDAGSQNSDTIPDHCRLHCRRPLCGDGVRDAGEQCDDGNQVNGDGCTRQCVKVQVQSDVTTVDRPDTGVECSTDAQCPRGGRCVNGNCVSLPLASVCTRNDQCASGLCVNGFCAPRQTTQQGSVTGTTGQGGLQGQSGPAAIAVMGAGAAAGFAWMRRRRRAAA